ncbi:hypothetical protein CHELA1G2_11772 [Hyphomicrobiales bacterium]|nr:hypothetical protein CHELA1G2_11772 [Hyphomicrobiales bacterium]
MTGIANPFFKNVKQSAEAGMPCGDRFPVTPARRGSRYATMLRVEHDTDGKPACRISFRFNIMLLSWQRSVPRP